MFTDYVCTLCKPQRHFFRLEKLLFARNYFKVLFQTNAMSRRIWGRNALHSQILMTFMYVECCKYASVMHLFLHQLTHNMTKDCSLNYKLCTWKLQALFWMPKQKQNNNLCTQHVLCLQFSCTELIIQWTICCHIVGQLDAKIRAYDKDLPVAPIWNCTN